MLIATYCGLILLASLAGGWIPLVLRLTHTRMQVATSFVAGLMLGVGLLHLLPHAFSFLKSIDRTAWWLLGGFLLMFFIQRFFQFHHHDVPTGENSSQEHAHEGHSHHAHGHSHDHGAGQHHHDHGHGLTLAERSARNLTWTGAALGLTLHTMIDGLALAASVQADAAHAGGQGALFGFGTFLVIILHKPFDAMAIGTLMAAGGRSKLSRHLVNGLFALAIPAGVLLFTLGLKQFGAAGDVFLGCALAFAAGTFLCIAASDLLPELQFHSHDRGKLSVALISGLALAIAIGAFESSGHDEKTPQKGAESSSQHTHDHKHE
jgi:zinc and cadmium transporter